MDPSTIAPASWRGRAYFQKREPGTRADPGAPGRRVPGSLGCRAAGLPGVKAGCQSSCLLSGQIRLPLQPLMHDPQHSFQDAPLCILSLIFKHVCIIYHPKHPGIVVSLEISVIVVSLVIPVFWFPFRKNINFFVRENSWKKIRKIPEKSEKPRSSSCASFFFVGKISKFVKNVGDFLKKGQKRICWSFLG